MTDGFWLRLWWRELGFSFSDDSTVGARLATRSCEVRFAGRIRSIALARIQRHRLPKSPGIRERSLLRKGDRTKDGDSESGEREPVGRRLVFSEGRGTGRG